MELRPYQREAIASAMAAWKQHRSVLMVMATGLGKTVTFANIAKVAVERQRRVLVVAHTQELVKQAARALERVIGCEVAIEMAEEASDEGTLLSRKPMVVVGTVQTLAAKRGSGLRCHKFRPDDFGLVIFDEAHTIEAVASEHLGIGVSSAGIERVLSKLASERTGRGLLAHYGLDDLEADVRRCRRAAEDFFAAVTAAVSARGEPPWRVTAPGLVSNSLGAPLEALARRLRVAGDGISSETERHDFHALADRLPTPAPAPAPGVGPRGPGGAAAGC